jgi:uncharacterized protein YndB with AHSA1/START domain
MKILKKILIVILCIIAIPFIIALFVKKEYDIHREITINKPVQEVFNYVKFLKNQEQYSKWVRTDPNMKTKLTGTDGAVGFIYAWDGNKDAGKGEQEIKQITENERIDIEVRFEKPMQGVSQTPIVTQALSANQTKVTWGIKGVNKYPMNFMNLFMDKMLGKDVETSLGMLKGILEKQ